MRPRENGRSEYKRDVLFWRIALAAIVLGEVGNNDLDMTFGAQGAGLEQRPLCGDAAAVHVKPGGDVVEGVDCDVEGLEEVVGEDVFGLGTDFIVGRFDSDGRVHRANGPRSS